MIQTRRMRWIEALLLVTGYLALDWVSFFHPLHGLNITPWDPAPALGLVFLIRFGWPSAVLIFIAIFLGDAWIRGLPPGISTVLALQLVAGYSIIAEVLRRRLKSEDLFTGRHGLFAWCLIIVAGTLLNSASFILLLTSFDLITSADWIMAVTRHWIGDSVGTIVTMPVIWIISSEHGRALVRLHMGGVEPLMQIVAAVAAIWLAFSLGAESEFKYFYVLFLPIVWAAARQGFVGAVLIAAVTQSGIIVAMNLLGFSAISVLEAQMLAVVLVMLGFFVGVVIDEQGRITSELRQTFRLAAAGEMAGALAHEINQPLTALSAYASACDRLLEQGDTGDKLRAAVHRIVIESERAGDVVRRLRDFFRTGATKLERFLLADLLRSCVDSFASRAAKDGIRVTLGPVPRCTLFADRLQMEVVMRNLLANAFDAVLPQPAAERLVHVAAAMEGQSRVCIEVTDHGPGLSAAAVGRLFEPFASTKSSGLGLGLAISRAIVEAHGGSMWAEVAEHGVFKLVMLVERKVEHDKE